jgi:hypothetical protein
MELFITVCVIIWGIALVSLCSRRDIEIHTKLTWVVIVLALNALGALIYLFFGPKRKEVDDRTSRIDGKATPFTPEGESWNPILGENRMAEGEGLNPRKTKSTEPENVDTYFKWPRPAI